MTPERREEIRKKAEYYFRKQRDCIAYSIGSHEECLPLVHIEQLALDVWDEAIEAAAMNFDSHKGCNCYFTNAAASVRSLKAKVEK